MLKISDKMRVFADDQLYGNEAVVIYDQPCDDAIRRQDIARSLAVSATVFAVPIAPERYRVYCHSPQAEIIFCGHGCLAAAHYILHRQTDAQQIMLQANDRLITASRIDADRSALSAGRHDPEPGLHAATLENLFPDARAFFHHEEIDIVVVDSPETVRAFSVPVDYRNLGGKYLAVTSYSPDPATIHSRYFPLAATGGEDSATGSLHFLLGPLWSAQSGSQRFHCYQHSRGGGHMHVNVDNDRVKLTGRVMTITAPLT